MAKAIKFKNDTYLDSSSVVHNKTKLSDTLKYSTSEVKIGNWIDGKPIYRKVFTGTGGTTNGKQIGTINKLGQIITLRGFILSNYGQWWSIPNIFSESGYNTYIFCDTNGNISFITGDFYNNTKPFIVIAEYTKNTD